MIHFPRPVPKRIPAALSLVFVALGATAQRPAHFDHANADFVHAHELFDMAKYGAAQYGMDGVRDRIRDPQDATRTEAEFYSAICAVRLFHDDASHRLLGFIDAHPESFRVAAINLELFRHYFNQKRWPEALDYAAKVNDLDLSQTDKDEFSFKRAYAFFQDGRMDPALVEFAKVKDGTSVYAPSATYYAAHINYTKKNYVTALSGFEKLQSDEAFGKVVPYYIAQIKFLQGDYDALIEYTKPLLAEGEAVKAKGDINRLAGEAYYRTGQYKEAQPYLEKSIQHGGLERGDRYIAGYVFYKNGDYKKALDQLNMVASPGNKPVEDSLAQLAAYHMGDCYLQLSEKNYARNAFKRAYDLNKDPKVTEDALFNYAKLAYELSFDPYNEAIIALRDYLKAYPGSPRHDEAQQFLLNVFLKTKNYEAALEALDAIKEKDIRLQEVYQELAFNRGVELYEGHKYADAATFFEKTLKFPVDKTTNAKAHFWQGESYFAQDDYDAALKKYDDLRNSSGAYETSLYEEASYSQGYCYFKQKQYDEAATSFRRYVGATGIDKDHKADAMVRIGDCYFVGKDEPTAVKWYDDAMANGTKDRDYAMFQKGVCQGLEKQYDVKIATLKKLLDEKPNSQYAADAKFQLGETYINLEKNEEALKYYEQVVDGHPNCPHMRLSMLQIALIHQRQGQTEKAIEGFKAVVTKYPTVDDTREALAGLESIYVELGRVAEYDAYVGGLTWFDKSTLDFDEKYYRSAETLYQAEKCDQAVGAFADYLAKYPRGAFTLNALFCSADCLYRAKKDHEALLKFEEVIARDAGQFLEASLYAASDIQYREERWEGALSHFERLETVAATPQNVLAAQVGQMRCLKKLERIDAAGAAADKVLKNADANADLKSEAGLIAALGMLGRNELDGAYTKFKAVAKDSKNGTGAEAKYNMAYIRHLQKKYRDAETEVFDLAKKFPSYDYWKAKGFILLADVYVQLDDRFQAKTTLQSVIDHCDDPGLVEEARRRLAVIEQSEVEPQAPQQQEQPEIDMNGGDKK
jgi:TolA-binding protein